MSGTSHPSWRATRPVSRLATRTEHSAAGPLSPFGEDHSFPLPVGTLRYAHPTDLPNRAGVQLVD